VKDFAVGNRLVGPDQPPYIVAEAGVHHYNSVELGKAYVLAARNAGADAVKFQTYEASRITTTWAPAYWKGAAPGLKQFDVFKDRARLTEDEYRELADYARRLGVHFMSTPFHVEAVAFLQELGVPALKIASADMTNLPLVRAAAKTGLPLFLSTGAATMAEVKATWNAIPKPRPPVTFLHCNLSYPTPPEQANLGRLDLLAKAVPQALLGYSDHTIYSEAPLACPVAVARGARVIEKHFTLNKLLPGDDHYHAVDAADLAKLVADCRAAYHMARDAKEMTPSEAPARENARRSVVAARALKVGQTIGPKDVDIKRPGTGLSPMKIDKVLGRRLKRALKTDDLVLLADLE
jgi:sialic acid synthase SpsE